MLLIDFDFYSGAQHLIAGRHTQQMAVPIEYRSKWSGIWTTVCEQEHNNLNTKLKGGIQIVIRILKKRSSILILNYSGIQTVTVHISFRIYLPINALSA